MKWRAAEGVTICVQSSPLVQQLSLPHCSFHRECLFFTLAGSGTTICPCQFLACVFR